MMRWSRPVGFSVRQRDRRLGRRKLRRPTWRLAVEMLEDRLAPATIQAISVADPSLGGTSVTPNGPSSLQDIYRPHNSVSADGHYVAFVSSASNIVPGDNNNRPDVFVRDTLAGKSILVSVNSSGTGSANNTSNFPVISANGRYVAFDSFATDLVAGMTDNNNAPDVFVRDLQTGTITLVSVNSAGTGTGNGVSTVPVISPDGRYVVFQSGATDLVTGYAGGVYVRDLVAGTTRLVSVNQAGTGNSNGGSNYWQITRDGRYVAFDSSASDLVSGDTNGKFDVFVRDMVANTTTLVSVNSSGTGTGNDTSQYPVISDDGRYVAFESYASNLGPIDTNNTVDVYVRDLVAGTTRVVSATSQQGTVAGDRSSDNPIISSNGRYVAFESNSDNLISGDNNNTWDVFVRDLTTNTTTLVSVAGGGTGTANGQSAYPVMTPDGRYVAFQSLGTNLTADSVSGRNVFLRDLISGTATLVSPNDNDTANDSLSDTPMISNDGQHVAFMSDSSTIISGDNNGFADDFMWSNVAPAATKFAVTGFPSPSTAGVAGSFTVKAEDNNGNIATSYTGTIHFTSSDAQAVLPADYTFTATDAGQHTFSATLKTAGNQSFTVTDTLNPSVAGSETGITVNATAASSLVITGFPPPTTAGASANFAVIAKDPFGNTATSYAGTVHFTSSDAQAVLPVDYTFIAADSGQHNFSALLKTAGSQSLTATDTVTSSITGSKSGIAVNPAAASSFVIVGFPAPIYAGASRDITVTAYDPFGNIATGYTGTVHFTSSDPLAVLPADYAFTNADAGVFPFYGITLKTVGSQSITAQDTGNSGVAGSLTGITVNAPLITPTLISDINTHTLGSNPQDFVSMGGFTYFTAQDELHGLTSMWRTDGTTISLVVDGREVGPTDLTNVDGILFFAGGRGLWKTDGTTTTRVANINPEKTARPGPSELTAVGATLYYSFDDGTHGPQLWKYDGTTNQMVTNVPLPFGFGPQYLTNVNGTLFFEDNGALWETDAMSAHIVATFNGSNPDVSFLTSFNGAVYFRADDGTHGTELWKSDGTTTTLLAEINPGAGSSNPHALIVVGNKLFFAASDSGFADKLWKTDGITVSLVSSAAAPDIEDQVAAVNGTLFFAGFGGNTGDELWKSDGTTTTLVADINPGSANSFPNDLTNVNGTLYFSAVDNLHGRELWKSDGITATLVADINPGITNSFPNDSNPNNLANVNGTLFFAADDGVHGNELWASDGTTAGTRLFKDIELLGASSGPYSMTNFNGQIYFVADDGVHGTELWRTDGVHTTQFDLNPGADPSIPGLLTVFNGQLYFEAYDDVNGPDLWKTNGSSAPTIVNFGSGTGTSPNLLTVVSGWLFFSAYDQNFNRQLWKTDGTTVSLIPINPTGGSYPEQFVVVGNQLYFMATDGVHGGQMWRTDGTTTAMLPADFSNINWRPLDNLSGFTNLNGTLFFAGNDGTHGTQLWKTDGTTLTMLTDFNETNGYNPIYLTVANGLVFFVANDGMHGNQVWQSDGTTTKQVTNANFYASSGPVFLTAVNNTLFFTGSDPVNGNALWETTGNTAPVLNNYGPGALTALNGLLYFETGQGPEPASLWKTDGVTTTFVADLASLGVAGPFLDVSNTLYFQAEDATGGFEPWKLVLPPLATKFVVTGFSSPATAGVPGSITVTAEDANGNVAASYSGTVHFTSSDPHAVLPADYTFTSVDGGQHIFSATLKTAGIQSLTATDTVTNTITGSQAGITVNPAAASTFLVSGYPSPITAGTTNNFAVTAKDAFGNTTTSYTGTVHFTTSAAKAVLPANYMFTSTDAGAHTFSATLRSAGTQSITATDTTNSSITGTQSGIVVNPAAPFKLAIARFPYKPTAGVAGSFRVTAQDMFSNIAPTFTDTVHFTSSDPQAVLPADYTFTSGDAGVHDFMATLKTAGSQSITVQDLTRTTIVSATQSNILMQPAAASTLQVSGFPSSVIAGAAHSFTVTAFDPYNNVATGYRGTVTFSSSDTQAMLPANYTFTSGDAGAHTSFSATLNTGGTQSITATDTVNGSIKGAEMGIMVVSMQPTAGIIGPPANASGSNGVPGQPLVYTLTASESGLDPNTVYSYTVQWGDGSPAQSFSGPSGTQVSHAFPAPMSYSTSVTATDPNGHSSLPASTSVSLTTLALEADPYYSSQTALYMGGTTGSDNIAITPAVRTVNGNLDYGVKVGMNMVSYGSFFSISRVVVYSQGGTDIVKTAAQTINGTLTYVSVPVMFFAGNGNDILNLSGSGSNANTVTPNNVLVGGGGTDRLIGGQGRDILIGGAGQATLQAGSGGDILIGGTTNYDNNAAALAAILAEWGSNDDYSTRMARLNGSMSGGLNGSYLLNSSTVHGNGLADNLYGGSGLDWYFAGMMDVLFNKTPGEVVTPI